MFLLAKLAIYPIRTKKSTDYLCSMDLITNYEAKFNVSQLWTINYGLWTMNSPSPAS